MSDEVGSGRRWKPSVNPWLIAATVALAAFMEVLDTSIANVALPHIAGDLGASTDQGTWVLTSYLVSNAIILPVGAWASSVIGRRNFFLLCITIFTAASFLCGIAPSLPILLIARVLQGTGGGGLQPMAQAIMADSFDEKKRGQAFALYGLVAVLAPSLGPTIGGWITDNYSWRWIFYINLPVGILAFFLVSRLVQDPPWIRADRANLRKLDYIGLGLLTVAMGGMQIMLDKGEENDWFASTFIRISCFLFVAGMTGLIWWQWRAKNPIMNLRLFKYKNFAICCFLMILVGGVLNAATVLEPQFLQQLMGYTATRAGEALAGGGLALLVIMPLGGIATGRFPARNMAAFGFACFAGAFLLHLHALHAYHDLWFCRMVANSSDVRDSVRLHCHHHRGLCRTSEGGEQSGLRDHQLCSQRRRQHLHRGHWSDRHQSFSRPSGTPAGIHATRQSRLRQPGQRAYFLLRWYRRRSGPRPHGTSCYLSATQSAGCCAGLSGHLPSALLDGDGHGGVRLHSKQEQARTRRRRGRSDALATYLHIRQVLSDGIVFLRLGQGVPGQGRGAHPDFAVPESRSRSSTH